MPFLPADPAAKAMLLACRQLPIHTDKARSAILVVTAGQFGKSPLHAMVVGDLVLMLPTDLVTMGIGSGGADITHPTLKQFAFYTDSITPIVLTPGSRWARVGGIQVPLRIPMVEVMEDKQLVMSLPDLLTVFRERDRQRHQRPFFRGVQIIYDIKDYQR
jgi:hypothetical protein